jgi:hypothetical protein
MESFGSRGKLLKKAVFLTFMLLAVSCSSCRLNIGPSFVSALEYSGTDVGGGITTNTTWTVLGSPYTVTADAFVLVDVFLTVEPGVTVKFDNGTSTIVDGTLIIQGNSAHETIFTSNAPSPAMGDWGSIRARTGGHIAGLEWTTIEYSTGGIEFPADSSYIVADCVFRANGVGLSGSNVNITRCAFEKNTNAVNAVNVQVMDCEFFNNTNAIAGSGACSAKSIKVWNNSGNGIQIAGPVTNCLVHDNGGYGVASDSIVDCLIYNNSGDGASAGSVVNCSVFNNGGGGISGGSVFNCSVYNNGGYGVNGGSITNCSIHDNGGYGALPGFDATLTNSSIFNNKGYGVVLQVSVMSQCSVYGNLAGGVMVSAGCVYRHAPDSYVNGTEIYNNLVGILFRGEANSMNCFRAPLHVSNCTIHNNTDGGIATDAIYGKPGGAEMILMMEHTRIDSNNQFGIRFDGSLILEISDCIITNHTVGASGAFGIVTGSDITNNSQIGLDAFAPANYYYYNTNGDHSIVTNITRNNIYGNTLYNIKSHFPFSQDLNATMNWWGTTNTTEIGAFIYDYYEDYNLSRVLFEPILASPIPEFSLVFALPLFMLATLLTVISCRRKRINAHLS